MLMIEGVSLASLTPEDITDQLYLVRSKKGHIFCSQAFEHRKRVYFNLYKEHEVFWLDEDVAEVYKILEGKTSGVLGRTMHRRP